MVALQLRLRRGSAILGRSVSAIFAEVQKPTFYYILLHLITFYYMLSAVTHRSELGPEARAARERPPLRVI